MIILDIDEQIKIIDGFIEAGYSYNDAYLLWEYGYNNVEDDLGLMIYNKALEHGCKVLEAVSIMKQVISSSNRQKTYSFYYTRLSVS